MPTVETPHTNLNKRTVTNHSHSIHSHSHHALTHGIRNDIWKCKEWEKEQSTLGLSRCETNQLGIWIRLSVVCDMAYGLAFCGTVDGFCSNFSCDMTSFHLFHAFGSIWFFVCFLFLLQQVTVHLMQHYLKFTWMNFFSFLCWWYSRCCWFGLIWRFWK